MLPQFPISTMTSSFDEKGVGLTGEETDTGTIAEDLEDKKTFRRRSGEETDFDIEAQGVSFVVVAAAVSTARVYQEQNKSVGSL